MSNISHLSVFNAWRALNEICHDNCDESKNDCLVCFAKSLLMKFNQLQRRIDKGTSIINFPGNNKKNFDLKKVQACYDNITKLCNTCLEYHNDSCYVYHTRNALELILFGKKLPAERLSYSHFLLENKVITVEQLEEAFILYQELNLPIGSLAYIKGLITQKHVITILNFQKNSSKLFGHAAKELGLLTDHQIETILNFQQVNKISISDSLIGLGYLSEEKNKEMYEKYKEFYKLK